MSDVSASLPASALAPTPNLGAPGATAPATTPKKLSPSQADAALLQNMQANADEQKQGLASIDAVVKKMEALNAQRPPPKLEQFKPPEQKSPMEAFNGWGGIVAAFAMIASRKTQAPLTASLKAATAGMNAVNQGNADAYNKAFEAWKANTDFAIKQMNLENEQYRDTMDLYKTDITAAEARMRTLAALHNDDAMKAAIGAGMGPASELAQKRQENSLMIQERTQTLEKGALLLGPMIEADKALKDKQAALAKGDMAAAAAADQRAKDAHERLVNLSNPEGGSKPGTPEEQGLAQKKAEWRRDHGGQEMPADEQAKYHQLWSGAESKPGTPEEQAVAAYKRDHPNATADELTALHQKWTGAANTGSGMSDDARQFFVDRYLSSGGTQEPHFTWGKAGDAARTKFYDAVAAEAANRGQTGSGLPASGAEFKALSSALTKTEGQSAAARTFADQAYKNLDKALELAPKAIPTESPWLNQYIERGEVAMGDPDIPPYAAQLLAAVNEVAKINSGSLGSSPATDSARKEVAENVSQYLAQGQIKPVIDVLKSEIKSRMESYDDTLSSLRKGLGDVNSKGSGSAKSGTAWSPIRITPDQYDGLQKGTYYIGPDGLTRQKQ